MIEQKNSSVNEEKKSKKKLGKSRSKENNSTQVSSLSNEEAINIDLKKEAGSSIEKGLSLYKEIISKLEEDLCKQNIKLENEIKQNIEKQDIIKALRSNETLLKGELEKQKKEINNLKESFSKKEKEYRQQASELRSLEYKISELEKRKDALEDDLGNFTQMANSKKDNEVYTLKNDIKRALKNEYNNYLEGKELSCSEDVFEAFKMRFFKIFAILKDFGISFEGDKK